MDLIWELKAVAVVIVLAFLAPNTGRVVARRVARPFRALAVHRKATVVFVGLVSLAITTTVGIKAGWPEPYIHDEFAYALAGDTFANGRVTNPTHPMWEHFESYHIIHKPSYQAKYPPGQGLVLALGQALFGHQLVGVWISTAVACAATCWMLQGWLPPRWALLGGFLTAVHPTVAVWWGETYWGGSVAMTGGALLYGAMPRLRKRLSPVYGVMIAIGLLILANSRPYEGLVASLPAGVVYFFWLFRSGTTSLQSRMFRVTVPLLVVLFAGISAMGYYNYRVTGSATTLPYQAWMDQYTPRLKMEQLLWQSNSSEERLKRIAAGQPNAATGNAFEVASLPAGATSADLTGGWLTPTTFDKVIKHHVYFLRIALTLAVLPIPWMLYRTDIRFAVATYGCVAVAVILNACSGNPHYYAPGTAALVLLIVLGIRRIGVARVGSLRWGNLVAVLIVPVTLGASFLFCLGWAASPVGDGYSWVRYRTEINEKLKRLGSKHLVLVHYEEGHDVGLEWVYNGADLDRSPVLWARPIAAERVHSLTEYYRDRRIWTLQADRSPPELTELHRNSTGRVLYRHPEVESLRKTTVARSEALH